MKFKLVTATALTALLIAATGQAAGRVTHQRALKGGNGGIIENNDYTPIDRPDRAPAPQKIVAIYGVPFTIFENKDYDEGKASFKQCTVINANGDFDSHNNAETWFFANYGASSNGEPSYADDKQNDDWFILPGLQFADGTVNYELKVDHGCNVRNMYSDFEFYIGTEPTVEAMTTKIGECLNFSVSNTSDPVEECYTFAIPDGKPGTYYIAIRDITKDDGRALFSSWYRNFRVTATQGSASMAAQISNATITPGANGALQATMTFNMPATDMTGKAIPASATVSAYIERGDWNTTLTGAPGSSQTVVVPTVQGDNVITIRADLDGIEGEPFTYTVYTGEVIATRVQGLKGLVSEDNLSYSLTWNAPLGGVNDGYVDLDRIRYDIYRRLGSEDEKKLLATVTDNAYTYTVAPGTPLASTTIYVLPRTDAGVSTDEINYTYDENDVYRTAVIGQPYVIPAAETFPGGQVTLNPLRREVPDDYRGRWDIMLNDLLEGGNEWCIMGYSPYVGYDEDIETMGRLGLPKISTDGLNNAAFNIKVYKSTDNCKKMQILAKAYGIDTEVIADVDVQSAEPAWGQYTFTLPPKFQNLKWVQLYIDVDYTDPNSFYIIDSYSFSNAAGSDLSVTEVTAPVVLSVGEEGAVTAKVYNQGINALQPKGHFSAMVNGSVVAQSSEMSAATLAPNTEATFEWTYIPAVEAQDKDVTVCFELTTPDDVEANNIAKANISVVEAEVPVVNDLVGHYSPEATNNIYLCWSEPDLTKPMTESFEDLDPFYYGDTYSSFTGVDGDGKYVFKFSDNEMLNEELPKSWLAVDYVYLVNSEGLEAHSGRRYLLAMSPYADSQTPAVAANDWLISSEIKPGSRVSFWANIISETYPESFRVLYSTTGTDVKSFVELKSEMQSRNGWRQYSYLLPKDAKYFAINYVSNDKFGLMIDDIRHLPLFSTYHVDGYNVYRNGQKVATVTECKWADDNHQPTDRYTVAAVVDGTEMPLSNVATLLSSGIDNIALDSADAQYFTTSGVKVDGGQLTPGVYIRLVGGTASKIVVK